MKFSIIVPMYNAEKYIEKCLDSLVHQKFKDYEIILINDCSTDNSKKIVEDKYKNIENIIFISNENNIGLSDTRNIGISISKGEYIIFVDSDDYIDEDMLLDAYNNIENNKFPDIIYFGFYEEKDSLIEKKYGYKSEHDRLFNSFDFMKKELKKRNLYAPACFAIYKRTFIINNNLRFESGLLHEDELWTPSVLLKANYVYLSNRCYYHYVIHQNSITRPKDTTKNGLDLKLIAQKIDELSKNIEDKELKKLLNEHSARTYMRAVSLGKLYRNEYKSDIDRSFPIRRTHNLYDKFKAVLFFINVKLYCIINHKIARR